MDVRWNEFNNFLADMGQAPVGTSIDRIDNNKGYSKANCRWATRLEQNNNQRKNIYVKVEGQRMTIAQAARKLQIKYTTAYWRYKNGGF